MPNEALGGYFADRDEIANSSAASVSLAQLCNSQLPAFPCIFRIAQSIAQLSAINNGRQRNMPNDAKITTGMELEAQGLTLGLGEGCGPLSNERRAELGLKMRLAAHDSHGTLGRRGKQKKKWLNLCVMTGEVFWKSPRAWVLGRWDKIASSGKRIASKEPCHRGNLGLV